MEELNKNEKTLSGKGNGVSIYITDNGIKEPNTASYAMESNSENDKDQCCGGKFDRCFDRASEIITALTPWAKRGFVVLLILAYFAYFIYAMWYRFGDEESIRLLVFTVFGVFLISCKWLRRLQCTKNLIKPQPCMKTKASKKARKCIRWLLYLVVLALIGIYLGIRIGANHPKNFVSLAGMAIYITILFLMSNNKRKIVWHTVFWGLCIQFGFALFILRTDWGSKVILWFSDRFLEFLAYSNHAAEFIFGPRFMEFYIAFVTMPAVIFFCAAMYLLSYLGALQFVIKYLGGFLSFCLNTSAVDSLNSAANIFLGGIESLMLVGDYLPTFTDSQLYCAYVNGLSSLAGIALVVFSGFGVPVKYLLAAAVMSAPAALVAAKMSYPEDTNIEGQNNVKLTKQTKADTVIGALHEGGMVGAKIVVNVLVTLIICLSGFAFVNVTIKWFGTRVGLEQLDLEYIFSYLLWPFAYIMGIDYNDCFKVARMLGKRAFATLAVAFIDMGKYIGNKQQFLAYSATHNDTLFMDSGDVLLPALNQTLVGGILSDRSEIIGTYALCGFSSIPGMGMALGGFAVLAPADKFKKLMRYVFRGFIAATIASYLTACVAGILYD